ncbi:NELFB [Cordylochernes scorpioides]|uniref:NELFB n=1 Tax=Cordylochernes scorpioides TaxID=51811 RepID=A0ABY6LNN8_9ARAC|nr:NELFB [Cordylochernes scorpioides]
MAGLEEVGIPGQEFLREALTNCSDPLKAIEEFQMENGILLPSLRTMLPLLDLHGLSRLEFHTSILEELKDRLLRQIEALGRMEGCDKDKKLKELLQKSFPVIKVPSLRPVVLCILQNMDRVEDKYLRQLVTNKELYQECGIQVKRQIWQDNQHLFGDEVYPLFQQYVKEKEDLLFDLKGTREFFSPSPKQRRQGEIIQRLVTVVGRNIKLYDTTLQFLRSLFHRTKNIHYCTLRSELLMALHDLEIQEITSVDPCHKFTWCLDACIREKNIEVKRSRELQSFLENSKNGHIEVLGQVCVCPSDIAMTLADPYAINFLATSTFKVLNYLIANETQPRGIRNNNNRISTFFYLLMLTEDLVVGAAKSGSNSAGPADEPGPECLGDHVQYHQGAQDCKSASSVNHRTSAKWRVLFQEPELVTKFLPSLMCVMVDDQVEFSASLYSTAAIQHGFCCYRCGASTLDFPSMTGRQPSPPLSTLAHPPTVLPTISRCLGWPACWACTRSFMPEVLPIYQRDPLCCAARQKDRQGLMRILGCLSSSHKDRAFEDTFLHTLVGLLIPMADEFATEDFCTVVFDEFFFVGLHENALCHCIKLLYHIFPKLPPSRLEVVMKQIEPIAKVKPIFSFVLVF